MTSSNQKYSQDYQKFKSGKIFLIYYIHEKQNQNSKLKKNSLWEEIICYINILLLKNNFFTNSSIVTN